MSIPVPIKNGYSHVLELGMENHHSRVWLPLRALGLSSLPRRLGKVTLDGVDDRRQKNWYCFVCTSLVMDGFLRKVYLTLEPIIMDIMDTKCLCIP